MSTVTVRPQKLTPEAQVEGSLPVANSQSTEQTRVCGEEVESLSLPD
jgi:hypothetical protein